MTLTTNNKTNISSEKSLLPQEGTSNAAPVRGLMTLNSRRMPATPGGRELVMMEFQRSSLELTRKFLETQERVMLAYLQGDFASTTRSSSLSSNDFSENLTLNLEPPRALRNEPVLELIAENVPAITGKTSPEPETIRQDNAEDPVQPELNLAVAETESGNLISAGSSLSPEELIEALVEIVSQRTGYPPEMLDPALDLEADLGIDSIKRVEILNSFRKLLPESAQSSLEEGIEKLASVKTLQGIMDWIRNDMGKIASVEPSLSESELAALAGT